MKPSLSMERTTEIEQQAAAWLARRDSGDWTESDEASLRGWLEVSLAHRIAFLRLEAAWEETMRLKALTAGLPPGAGARSEWRVPISFEERHASESPKGKSKRFLAIAASLLLVIGVMSLVGTSVFRGDRYSTPVGGTASVPLQDGSKITLNTASSIRVELTDQERYIELSQGEAYFDVAKDPVRPFVVSAGDKRIVAVGTQFSVRRNLNSLKVVVTEGKVRIEDPARPESAFLVSAGGIVKAESTGVIVQKRTPLQAQEALSWRVGYLTFDDTPLADAVVEFNRYNAQEIIIKDPSASRIPLTGKFKATNSDAFIRLLEDGYGIRSERSGEKILLSAQ
jgi:transmembrane sensor